MLVTLHKASRRDDESIVAELRFSEKIYHELASRSALLTLLTASLNLADAYGLSGLTAKKGVTGQPIVNGVVHWDIVLKGGHIQEVISQGPRAIKRRAKLLRGGVEAMIKQLVYSLGPMANRPSRAVCRGSRTLVH